MPLALAPDQLNQLLIALTQPKRTLADIASAFHLSLIDLADWLLLPETRVLLDRLEQAARRHAQLLAAVSLPSTITTLNQCVQDDLHAAAAEPAPDHPKARALRARERDQARKAINLLIKLAQFTPAAQPKAHARSCEFDIDARAQPHARTAPSAPASKPDPLDELPLADLVAQARAFADEQFKQFAEPGVPVHSAA